MKGSINLFLLMMFVFITSVIGEDVNVCACGTGSCEGVCKIYPTSYCVAFYQLCNGQALGYVIISGNNNQWTGNYLFSLFKECCSLCSLNHLGNFFSDPECLGDPLQSFSSPCGVCNSGLDVKIKCPPSSKIPIYKYLVIGALVFIAIIMVGCCIYGLRKYMRNRSYQSIH